MNNAALLIFTLVLFASCYKETETHITNVNAMFLVDDITETDAVLKERYLIIEDSIDSYVEKLEDIEERYYTYDMSHDELLRFSLEGLVLQEKLTDFLRNTISENLGNPLGLYLLAVYGELFSIDELQALIERIPPYPDNLRRSPFYEKVIRAMQERIQK